MGKVGLLPELGFTEPRWKEGIKFNFLLGPLLRTSGISMFTTILGRVTPEQPV